MAELTKFQLFIDGAYCDASDGSTFESRNPATGEPWALMPAASADDVDRALSAAHCALHEGNWPAMNATQRGKLLYRLADLLADNAEELGRLETTDTGKLFKETRFQANYMAEFLRYYAGLADKVEGQTLPIDKPDMEVMTWREPIGVVAAVVPWNSQVFLAAVKLGPALAAGCTLVLKASEDGPAPLLALGRLIDEAGFPPGVVNIVTGFGDPCGKALTAHRLVNRIAFTGGPETARHVVANSANNLAHVSLELGGKSPLIVFNDADLDSAVNGVIAGIFGASGQSCVAGSRLLLQDAVYDQFLATLCARAKNIIIGDPLGEDTHMGPLATEAQRDKIERLVAETIEAGGRLLHGGKRPTGLDAANANGSYYEPTIIACDSETLPTVENELFGPVLSVLRFSDEADALRIANASEFGLASGVFSRNVGTCLRMSRGIRAGIVWVNTYRAVSPVAPFGGYGKSGYGRESGSETILDYTRVKTVWLNSSDQPMADPFVMR